MAVVRNALRALAMVDAEPQVLADRLNRFALGLPRRARGSFTTLFLVGCRSTGYGRLALGAD